MDATIKLVDNKANVVAILAELATGDALASRLAAVCGDEGGSAAVASGALQVTSG